MSRPEAHLRVHRRSSTDAEAARTGSARCVAGLKIEPSFTHAREGEGAKFEGRVCHPSLLMVVRVMKRAELTIRD